MLAVARDMECAVISVTVRQCQCAHTCAEGRSAATQRGGDVYFGLDSIRMPEQGGTPIPGDIRLQLRQQPPSLNGRCENVAMLNARSENAPNRNFHAEQETSMDGIVPIEAVGFSIPQPHFAPRSTVWTRAVVIMAIIIVMTLLTILALDYASIHLPVGSDELCWPPFG